MPDLTPYTSTERVRNSLGLTDNEVPDEMLAKQSLDQALLIDLDEWYPTHEVLWKAYRYNDPAVPTSLEKRKGRMLELFATQFCAAVVSGMWLAMPQLISDGKDTMSRFNKLDLQALSDNMKGRAAATKGKLLTLEDPARTAGFALALVAKPSFDPVTGSST